MDRLQEPRVLYEGSEIRLKAGEMVIILVEI